MSVETEVFPPERLTNRHDLSAFSNGRHPSLDRWLKETARTSEGLSARTYVLCLTDEPNRVIGYYSLSTTLLQRAALPAARLRQGMPQDVPALLIGRLAVDTAYQGVGLGAGLLHDALGRCIAVSEIAAVRAVIVHAIDDEAAGFYGRYGFIPSPVAAAVQVLPIERLRKAGP